MSDQNSRILTIEPPIDLAALQEARSNRNESHTSTTGVARSPLWMLTNEPQLNGLVMNLQQLRHYLLKPERDTVQLHFSLTAVEQARKSFGEMIQVGEETLHHLAELLCNTFLNSFQIDSVVIGETENESERFTLTQTISASDLYSTTDIDLGNRQLNKLRFFDGERWNRAHLIANVVDYQPTQSNHLSIHRITSRIKAEQEIWNKVVDEIFNLDGIVVRDKKLRHLSRFVKDAFGIKIVVAEQSDVQRVHEALTQVTWTDEQLEALGIDPGPMTRELAVIEFKDYLADGERKQSGWNGYKSVVRWSNKTFEIQIQPLRTFLREREWLTKESHKSFKIQRESIREQIAAQIPLFGFYQRLLRWLFLNPDEMPPEYEGIQLLVQK